ncbi:hypothetical protein IFM89_013617 [Coptis chinensis]|uniref:KIB1-4 beta-propeller domain-containing protein n=1 Tax=Coptis chinensis TaxID=261450 RepID=A0A835MEA2_9MAGN|nr:hypothetical protein IFM89_013617 [Coptis chinensis]
MNQTQPYRQSKESRNNSTTMINEFDWSEVHQDLLDAMKEQLEEVPDLIRFACVCLLWRSVVSPDAVLGHKGRLPWFVVPYSIESTKSGVGEEENYCRDGLLGFYSILDGITYKLETPELLGHQICGASFGWFITIHANSEMQLFQPFTKKLVYLPPFTKFPFCLSTRTSDEGGLI